METGMIIAIALGVTVGACIIAAAWLAGQHKSSSYMSYGPTSDADIAAMSMATTVCLLAAI